jgi:hypothetical protein
MSTETIYKLEPHRTMHLSGVDRYGAMGSLWGASATGFQLSGVFRDMADFAVLKLWEADDYFGHYQVTKYLPDFDFSGMVLTFDLQAAGTQQLDSPVNQWIPWRSLSCVLANGKPVIIDLWPHATKVGGTYSAASTTITINGVPTTGDKVTIWYQNAAFTVTCAPTSGSLVYWPQAAGTTASVQVNSTTYTYTVPAGGQNGGQIAAGVAAAAAADPLVTFTATSGYSGTLTYTPKVNTGAFASVGGGYLNLWLTTDAPHVAAAKNIANQITNYGWTAGGYILPLTATASGNVITVTCTKPGADGNSVTLYSTVSPALSLMSVSPPTAPLTGGVSAGIWRVSIDFTALGIDQLRQAWLTFSPERNPSGAYADTEWSVIVSNWTVTDPNGKRPLKIAGPGSTRVGSRDPWVTYSGTSWAEEASNQPGGTGWFWKGFAHRMGSVTGTPGIGDYVTVKYSCQHAHDLYLGTSLYSDRGIVSITLDGAALPDLDCFIGSAPSGPMLTRRKVNSSTVAAGSHTVVITLKSTKHTAVVSSPMWDANSSGHYFYFDYLEAAVVSDVLDPVVTYSHAMPATDFDTDHAYKVSPQRLTWMLSRLGFAGELDHYLGVFWWNQRKRVGGSFPVLTVTFSGTWANGDTAFISISGETIGKSVFSGDDSAAIASHFAYFINSTFTGLWASASGGVLTITNQSPEWSFDLVDAIGDPAPPFASSAGGTVTYSGSLSGGTEGTWMIDDTVTPVINRAVTDWHADLWAEVHAKGWSAVAAFSMELVNPPDDPAHGAVYAQRYSDGTIVSTDTGFGGLASTQCTFSTTVLNYQKQAFKEMAGLMSTAGLTPWLQFGEFLWWFFSRVQNRPIGYASYTSPISIGTVDAVGNPAAHRLLTGQGVLVAGVKGDTAANVETTCTVVDTTHVTLDGTSGNGAHAGGGTISGGGMAYYDAFTAAAASAPTALNRALASFWTQDDNPTAHSADVAFLAGQLKAHIDGIRSYVLASYAGAKFELLFPYDVCYPSAYWTDSLPYPQGGRLNHAVNLPAAYLTKSGSGLDRIKMEGLAWGASYRTLAKAEETVRFPYTIGTWSKSDTRYLMPWFNGGCPWEREYLFNMNASTPCITLWAFDHGCLMGWPLPLPLNQSRAKFL